MRAAMDSGFGVQGPWVQGAEGLVLCSVCTVTPYLRYRVLQDMVMFSVMFSFMG